MNRRTLLLSSLAASTVFGIGDVQSTPKVAHLGWLTAQRSASLLPFLEAFREGLRELGYREGETLDIQYRYGDDDINRVASLGFELARKPVDVLVVQGAAVPLVFQLRLPVPSVYVFSGDPVRAGLAETLSRPLGNMTGLTFMAAELNSKRVEMASEIVPDLREIAIISNTEHPGSEIERTYSEEAARKLGLGVRFFSTTTKVELTTALRMLEERPAQAILLFADGFAIQYRNEIIHSGMRQRTPVISGWPVFAQSGAICTYGPKLSDCYGRLAYYADRILKGSQPSDLPIERPSKFETVVNLKTARALGFNIPQSLIVSADELIE